MNIDFEKALTFVSKDPQWGNKLIAGAGLMLLSIVVFIFPFFALLFDNIILTILFLAISCIISVVCIFAIYGYGCEMANNFIKNPEETSLPDWKHFRHLTFLGFKYSLGMTLYILPLILVYLIGVVSMLAASASDSSNLLVLSGILFLLLLGIGSLLYIFILIFLPLFSANFIKEQKISSFINFKQAFGLLKGRGLDYVIFYLLTMALGCIISVVGTVLACTVVGIIFLPMLYFYAFLVYAQMCAQFVNIPPKTATQANIQTEQEQQN